MHHRFIRVAGDAAEGSYTYTNAPPFTSVSVTRTTEITHTEENITLLERKVDPDGLTSEAGPFALGASVTGEAHAPWGSVTEETHAPWENARKSSQAPEGNASWWVLDPDATTEHVPKRDGGVPQYEVLQGGVREDADVSRKATLVLHGGAC